jgi:hypothetical protein
MTTQRTATMGGIWANNAPNLQQGNSPVGGITYGKTGISTNEIESGWPYDVTVDSAKTNEILRRVTTLLKMLEEQGILPWCTTTNYGTGALALATNNIVYQALSANSNTEPSISPTVWKVLTDVTGFVSVSDFPYGSNGRGSWQTLPNGLIMQMGSVENPTVSPAIFVQFPISFTVYCYSFVMTPWLNAGLTPTYSHAGRGAINGLTVYRGGDAQNFYFDFIAIGR